MLLVIIFPNRKSVKQHLSNLPSRVPIRCMLRKDPFKFIFTNISSRCQRHWRQHRIRSTRRFLTSAASIGPNRLHQNLTVSWLISMPPSGLPVMLPCFSISTGSHAERTISMNFRCFRPRLCGTKHGGICAGFMSPRTRYSACCRSVSEEMQYISPLPGRRCRGSRAVR